MKKQTILGSTLCLGLVAACSSSSSTGTTVDSGKGDVVTTTDAGRKPDGGTTKDAAKDTAGDKPDTASSTPDTGVDAGPVRHLLVTYDTTAPTTMFAVNLATGNVDGTLTSHDKEAITDTSNASAPFLLNQVEDVIDRLDPSTWTVAASYSVALPADGGTGGSDSMAVVVAEPTQAYVIRYNSNVIDVIDPTKTTDAGTPTGSIDLTSLVQTADADGFVEATAGTYVSSSKLLYVVLGNVNLYATDTYMGNTDTICGTTSSTVIAIDTMTNAVKTLGGTGPGGGIALAGYDPTSAVYDAANGRIFIFEAGCNIAPTTEAGAPGAVKLRGVEAVDLTTNTSKVLVDTSDKGFPGSFVYINAHQAVVGFSYPTYEAYNWDPTQTTLASQLPNAPNLFDYDGNGNLVGATVNYPAVGSATTDILSMSLGDGTATTLVANVIPPGNGYIGSVGVWPRP